MIRLHIIAEGQTEEEFVNTVLAEHLAGFDVYTDVHCVTTKRTKTKVYRGGSINYEQSKKDIMLWINQERSNNVRFTTMFDLYRLPNNFPEFEQAQRISEPYQKIAALETAFGNDINDYRFIPYIQLHEFEALILSEPTRLRDSFPEYSESIQRLLEICQQYQSPELINDGETTAPSKRIMQLIPSYDGRKVSVAPLMVQKIGLARIRSQCPHFDRWLTQLERLND